MTFVRFRLTFEIEDSGFLDEKLDINGYEERLFYVCGEIVDIGSGRKVLVLAGYTQTDMNVCGAQFKTSPVMIFFELDLSQ
jgi:hypothetical protein